ncbi:GRF-type domain-containing protein [Abeliophyllum distichum]|uniref:GRF-type domain-containing protein n=1 Tax=Abeliophyllum distichum TaxID=126358 RepID=A0ABD1PCZ9_9LAMI
MEGRTCRCGHVMDLKTSWTDANPGRRFFVCDQKGDRCRCFVWYDPPICDRSKVVIPGLLRSTRRLEDEISTLQADNRRLAAENIRLEAANTSFESDNITLQAENRRLQAVDEKLRDAKRRQEQNQTSAPGSSRCWIFFAIILLLGVWVFMY